MMRRALIIATAGGALAASAGWAATIRVPEDSPSVLAAVDLAVPGDTVLVGPGTWSDTATRTVVTRHGSFTVKACAFPRGGVLIRGSGVGATTLDVGGSAISFAAAIEFAEREGEGPLVVEAMALTGASGFGGECLVGLYGDKLILNSCRIYGNDMAVDVLECPLEMADCELVDNADDVGIVRVNYTPVRMSRCRFEHNVGFCVTTIYDPGDGPAIFQDCQFVRNRGPGDGVGLNLQSASGYLVENCLFQENIAESSIGAGLRAWGSGTIRFCVFAYDSVYAANGSGGGIVVLAGSHEVHSNTFVGCYAGLDGAAFAAAPGATGSFHNNVVAYSPRPAVRFASGTSFTSGCNLFWGNAAGDFGGGGAPAPTDFTADPLFCDLSSLDLTVRDDSPCLFPPTPSCGPVGAFGAGCGGVAIEPTSFGRIKAMYR